MDIKKLTGLLDAESIRISDSKRQRTMQRSLKSKLMDTESTEEAVDVAVEALEGAEPEEVVTAVVQALSGTIEELAEQVKDSERKLKAFQGKRSDSKKGRIPFSKKLFKEMIMDTESTEEAVDVAVEALETADPEEVVRASIELLGSVVDELTN